MKLSKNVVLDAVKIVVGNDEAVAILANEEVIGLTSVKGAQAKVEEIKSSLSLVPKDVESFVLDGEFSRHSKIARISKMIGAEEDHIFVMTECGILTHLLSVPKEMPIYDLFWEHKTVGYFLSLMGQIIANKEQLLAV